MTDVLYPVGKILTLDANLNPASSDQQTTIQLRIIRQQLPYTLSSGSVVEEVSDLLDKTEGNIYFLKMFDRRSAEQLREDSWVEPWSEDLENNFTEGIKSGKVEKLLENLRTIPNYKRETEDDWDAAEEEADVVHQLQNLYKDEVATYLRLASYQGICIPRLLGTVTFDMSPPNVALTEQQRELYQQKGIILEYLRGFTLRDMIHRAAAVAWQDIFDQAIKIVDILGDHNILNKDVRLENFMVVPRPNKYQVFMIDFGLCRFRGDDESDEEWGRDKWMEDEDGAKIIGVSFGDVDPFSIEAVELYEKTLTDAQDQGIRVKVLLLCNPHNPLGRCYTPKVLQAYMRLCQKHNLHLLSDEIYSLSVWKNENVPEAPGFTSVLSIDTDGLIDVNLVHALWGMSKDFGANGIRIGCLITRNEAFMRACVANSDFSGPSSLSDLAATSILLDDAFLESFIKTNRLRLAENYKIVTEFLANHDIPYKEGSNAGLFVWADLFAPNRTLIDNSVMKQDDIGAALRNMEEKMTEVLLKERIFVASGGDFGTDVSGWYRIVFAHERTYLLEGLERIVRAVKEFGLDSKAY
ncbi:hypothetical protein FPSE5266_08061 [Fusarium pseudograminearum]|nr:hypothetical protein FPSE5266_08061 [Fusarium pseudograminearum]